MTAEIPKVNSVWQHKNGDLYVVTGVANTHATPEKAEEYPLTVVYRKLLSVNLWARPFARWHGSFTRIDVIPGQTWRKKSDRERSVKILDVHNRDIYGITMKTEEGIILGESLEGLVEKYEKNNDQG